MPLSGAEKTRRYRERLKKERPEEYKAQCTRNLQRMKTKRKNISDMTPLEAEQQREQWRIDKRKSDAKKRREKLKKDTAEERVVTINTKKNETILKKCRALLRKCKNITNVLNKVKTQKETYKKRYQRLEKKTAAKIKELETTVLKLKAREEVLELTLKKSYGDCKSHAEKRSLKKIIQNSSNKTYVCKLMGLKTKPRPKEKKVRTLIIPEIEKFYLRDDVSRNTAGKKETRTKHKKKKQIRYLVDTLMQLYQKYKSEGGRYGFTTFYKNKPFYVLSPHLNSRNTCLCVKHSNIDFLHNALLKNKVVKTRIKDILNTVVCDLKNYRCMYNKCDECKDKMPDFESVDNEKEVSWFRWETQTHSYTKKEGKENMVTKRTLKVMKTGTISELKSLFLKDLLAFKTHYYNMNQQQNQYQQIISNLSDKEVAIVVDFSENYEAKLCCEIQAMHFGASKRQITLHTGMIYWRNKCQSFCTIADANNHQPAAIWAHLAPIIRLIKKDSPNTSIFHYYSDGPSSQYRQKKNFYLLSHFTLEYGLQYATWSYYESGHGKSVADGIGGSVKRALDRKVTLGADVTNADDAYAILKECMKTVKVFLIPDDDIDEIAKLLPSNVQPLKGTQKVHQIITLDKNRIKYRDISCFCQRGLCDCYSPQTHNHLKISNHVTADLSLVNENQTQEERLESEKECLETSENSISAPHSLAVEDNEVHSSLKEPSCSNIPENEPIMIDLSYHDESLLYQEPPFIIFDTPQLHHNTFSDQSDEILDTDISFTRQAVTLSPDLTNKKDSVKRHLIGGELAISSPNMLKRNATTSKVQNHTKKFKSVKQNLTGGALATSSSNILKSNATTSKMHKHTKKFKKQHLIGSELAISSPNILKRLGTTSKVHNHTQKNKPMAFLECNQCTSSILGQKIKCIACKKWTCDDCVHDITSIDYICDKCLEGD